MPSYQIQQSSTAYPLVFLLVSSTDHVTPVTGLGSGATVTIRKVGGSFASPSGAISEIANGWYQVAGNATDSNTLGPLLLHATGTGTDPADMLYEVVSFNPQDTVRLGLTCLPNTAVTTNASLLTSGTGTDQISVSAGKVLLQATQTGVTIPTVTTVTNQLTAAQIATGVWQDTTAGDFTVASSIGKSLYTSGATPGAAGGHFIAGTNAATTVTTSFTTTFTGNLTGSVGSVTGAVGSVTGNVGGNVVGSVASVTGAVGSVTGNVGGNVVGSVASVTGAVGSVTGNVGGNVVGSVGSVTGLTTATIASAVLTTQMTESYNTDGTAPTLTQACLVTMQRLTEFAISSQTITVKKLDGSTTAYVLAMDATAPSATSSTRSS